MSNQSTSVQPEEIVQAREKIRHQLHIAYAAARNTGKPLLILVGEIHGDPQSLLLETIILQEAHKLGLKHFSRELDGSATAPKKVARSNTVDLIAHQARYYSMNIHYVDDLAKQIYTQNDQALVPRNKNIGDNLSRIGETNLMVTGAKHLAGLSTHPDLIKTHTILTFDVTPDYIDFTHSFTRISLPGDARELSFYEILNYGLGNNDALHFRRYLKDNDLEFTQADALTNLKLFPTDAAIKKRNPLTLIIASDAYYDLGEDERAGRLHALASILCKTLPKEQADRLFCNDYTMLTSGKSREFRQASEETLKNHNLSAHGMTPGIQTPKSNQRKPLSNQR